MSICTSSTTGTDADWIVKVIDVYPNDYPDPKPNPAGVKMGGYQQLIRGRCDARKIPQQLRETGAFTPEQPTSVKFTMPDVFHTLRSGHKLMIQVQSTWFPLVDRNPQQFIDIYTAKETDFRKATQRIYRGRETPSRVSFQVLP